MKLVIGGRGEGWNKIGKGGWKIFQKLIIGGGGGRLFGTLKYFFRIDLESLRAKFISVNVSESSVTCNLPVHPRQLSSC